MIHFLYNISIYFYGIFIHIASLFNSKAKLWVKGRQAIFQKLESEFKNRNPKTPLVWVHCASLGEFEQGRPLIEKIKIKRPESLILLTFFSPSGYEIRKNYNGADYVYYLPLDTQFNSKKFIEIIKPDIALFVKYEFWFNYLKELKKQEIPTYLVCGIFRKEHYFFKNYTTWFCKQLEAFTHFYLQDDASKILLNSIGYTNTTIAGDTRFDRVFEISKNVKEFKLVKKFAGNDKVLVAGSAWKEDLKLISESKFKTLGFKLIIASHEVDEITVQSAAQQFNKLAFIRYSQATEQNISTTDVLIIDNIGMLSSIYQYGTIAIIGGGFGKGIHNILEAATFGLPVIFGPNFTKFNEAKELIQSGGAFSVSTVDELNRTIDLLDQSAILKQASFTSKNYVETHTGATELILTSILK
ncbi:MAG: glycosyltransferase N-terminal domain-containing protein [Bacteroidota bacterium]